MAKKKKSNSVLQSSPFKEKGRRKELERTFDDKLDKVLDDFSDFMWS